MPYIQGEASRAKESRVSAEEVTANRLDPTRVGMDVVAHTFCVLVGSDTTEAGSSSYIINATSHSAAIGDVILLTSGGSSGRLFAVNAVDTNSITLAQSLSSDLGAGVTFDILRFRFARINSSGELLVSATIPGTVDTELPAATTPADGDSIPSTPTVGALMRGINASGTVDNAKLAKAHDVDSGGGTEYAVGVTIRKPGSGASTDWMTDVDTNLATLVTELYVMNGAMSMRTDDAGGGVTYQGWAAPGSSTASSVWRIRKIVEASGDYTLTFADGNRNFDNVWDNRASLTYT